MKFVDNRTIAACAGWALVMLAFVPWYLEPDGVRSGIGSGVLGVVGLLFGVAAWVLALYPRNQLKNQLVMDLSPEQVAFLCAVASTVLLVARLLFKPTFDTVAASVETKPSVFLAAANAGLLAFACLKQIQATGVGMPFSGALAARSLPDQHASGHSQAQTSGWSGPAEAPSHPPTASSPGSATTSGAASRPQVTANSTSAATPDEGWYPDPSGLYVARYFNGRGWTGRVRDSNSEFDDPNFSGG